MKAKAIFWKYPPHKRRMGIGLVAIGHLGKKAIRPAGVKNFKLFEERSDEFLKFSRADELRPKGVQATRPIFMGRGAPPLPP